MAYTKALYEIVDECRKSKNVKIKAQILKDNESTQLIDMLQLTYNPSIQWLLPEGNPPYTPAEGTDENGSGTDLEGALFGKMRMMKYFISVDGGNWQEEVSWEMSAFGFPDFSVNGGAPNEQLFTYLGGTILQKNLDPYQY